MQCKGAVLRQLGLPAPYAQSKPLTVESITLDAPQWGEVVVKIHAAGLCHSDLSAINGDRPWPMPIVIGHEAAAEVVELGGGVNDLKAGDHVVLIFRPSCGACDSCVVGRPALCSPGGDANASGSLLGGYKRLSTLGGERLNHHLGCSAFAQFATVSRRSLVKIEASLPWHTAALFGCAVLTGAGAVVNTAKVEAGASTGVVGLGGVGFSSLLACIASGASVVVAVDRLETKLEMARSLGATHVFNASDPDVIQKVKAVARSAGGPGLDYVFEMAGSVAALELAYRITGRGGTTVTAGLPNPAAVWSLQAVSLIAEERTVKGSYIGSCIPSRDVPRFVSMYLAGKLPVDRLLSETVPLSQINPALDRLANGESVRQVITMEHA
jgi:alcohol dehydrogenase